LSQTEGQDEFDLERRALAAGAFYVSRIERDLRNQRLSFALIANPEESVVVRRLVFTDVREFKELWNEEEDPDLIEQIIGLHQCSEKGGIRYLIRLERSEMHFCSATKPQIIETGLFED
jgi:hypothetical protein